MNCKKGTQEKCMCLQRKCDGCISCEKEAIERIAKSGKSFRDIVVGGHNGPYVNWDIMKGLNITVDGLTGSPGVCKSRSAVDILRGVCDYCAHDDWQLCNGCEWMNGNGYVDHWIFDERLLEAR